MTGQVQRRIRGAALVVAAGAALLGLAACGDDDGGGDSAEADRLVEAMVDEGATEEEARCLVDAIGVDGVERMQAPQEELSEDETAELMEAVLECAPGAGG